MPGFAVKTNPHYTVPSLVSRYKEIIAVFLKFKRPLTIMEIKMRNNYSLSVSASSAEDEVIQQFIDEGVIKKLENNTYEMDYSKLPGLTQVVPQDKYSKYYYRMILYFTAVKFSEVYYEQALDKGLQDLQEIQDYIVQTAKERIVQSYNRSRNKKVTTRGPTQRKKNLDKLQQQTDIANKLLRGEISVRQFKQQLQEEE